jgi:hypothetical protein
LRKQFHISAEYPVLRDKFEEEAIGEKLELQFCVKTLSEELKVPFVQTLLATKQFSSENSFLFLCSPLRM